MAKAQIYQIKVTLNYSSPPIWRRLLVPSDVTLDRLHDILQVAMGWYDAHLHQFVVGGRTYYGVPHPDFGDWIEMQDERKFRLNQVVSSARSRFSYEYDFGDSW